MFVQLYLCSAMQCVGMLQFWLSQQKPETLNPCIKYKSQVSFTGRVYVSEAKVNLLQFHYSTHLSIV